MKSGLRWLGYIVCMGEITRVWLMRKLEGNRRLWRAGSGGDDNIKMDRRIIVRVWTGLVAFRTETSVSGCLVNTVVNLRVG
jgi:hypothetical protein